jgi:endonuclease/exonuclease/phosphatase (EEP) superfamily protein YafD
LSHLKSYEITTSHAATLSSAVIVSLSKEYRQAKNFYKLISKNKKFSNDHAAQKLKELSEWQQEVNSHSRKMLYLWPSSS